MITCKKSIVVVNKTESIMEKRLSLIALCLTFCIATISAQRENIPVLDKGPDMENYFTPSSDDKPRGEAEFTQTIPRREGRRRKSTDDKPKERLSLLRVSRGAKEEDEVKSHF